MPPSPSLQEKYNELLALHQLTEKLCVTLDIGAVMKEVVIALKTTFTQSTIAYILAPADPALDPNFIYVFSSEKINQEYLNAIKENLTLNLQTVPTLNASDPIFQKWLKADFNFKIIEGALEAASSTLPESSINIPIIAPGTLAGVINVSTIQKKFVNEEKIKSAYTIVNSAANTINQLRQLISAEKARAEDLIQNMVGGVIMFGKNQNIITANPAALAIIKTKKIPPTLSLFFKNIQILVEKKGKNMPVNIIELAAAAIGDNQLKIVKEAALDGKFFNIYLTPIRDHQRLIVGGAALLHDITRLKQTDIIKTEFITITSHQLRTPVTGIKLFAEIIEKETKDKLDKNERGYIKNIRESANRMSRLINDLIEASQIETGHFPMHPELIDLVKFINATLSELGYAKIKDCSINFLKPRKKLPKILIDPDMLHIILSNFLTNAVSYSPKERCRITISLVIENNKIIISVADQGIGVRPTEKEKIFEKFFRSSKALEMETVGNGLGLYINKILAAALKGKIWFESEEGKGSAFYLSLPLKTLK